MHIAIVTAGGAGMFCGACMHDNSWARALMAAGHEVSLVPTYTPIRVDEPSLARERVFFGGINVYLDAKSRLWRKVPRSLKSWLNHPKILNLISRLSIRNDASQLGDLTLAMLEGDRGPHRPAVEELTSFLANDLKPDVVIFSNTLLSGSLRRLKEQFSGPVCAVLQGDDVFLDGLREPFKRQSISAISEQAKLFDRIFTHTVFYRDYMADYLGLDVGQFETLPLSIDPAPHTGQPNAYADRPPTIGYFARIAPEKGLHRLVDAVEALRRDQPDVRLRVGGYLGGQHDEYFQKIRHQTSSWGDGFEYIGSPATLEEKVTFLSECDVFSVPAQYLEPKGLYVLEALANGVPVVQPDHGAFPELIQSTGGGWLFDNNDPAAFVACLSEALQARQHRQHVAEKGYAGVREKYSPQALAQATSESLTDLLGAETSRAS